MGQSLTHIFCSRQGPEGVPLDGLALRRMEAFLSAAAPRVRVLGGTRFDGTGAAAPEWAAFGSYCFLLPRLELLEASGCCLLSCTLAWRESVGPSERCASACLLASHSQSFQQAYLEHSFILHPQKKPGKRPRILRLSAKLG